MSPLVKKEIRLLLPAWVAALLVTAVLPPFLQILSINNVPYNPDILPDWFGFACLLLSLATFGQEFSSKTFPVQLSQPIERSRIWWTKVTILAAAFASILLALFVCYKIYFHLNPVYRLPFPVGALAVCGPVFFSGGLWTTLLFRRILEAFWLTLLTPIILMAALFGISEYFHWSNQVNNYVMSAIFLIYSLAGFFWARRLFLQAQDLQWTGGMIAFSRRKRVSEPTKVSSRPHHWLSALVWKELQLQQVNILIAIVVLGLHLTSLVIRQVHPNFANPNVIGLLELIWALWLVMPLLIGSAAVAEERGVGVVESQFCLPVTRRTQFVVKFLFGLILSLIVGGVMPFVLERGHDLNYGFFIVVSAIFFISFYASTLARTTLQAIGVSIILCALIYLYEVATANNFSRLGRNWPYGGVGLELLKLYLGVPILLLALSGLMYRNFKWLYPDGKPRWRNGITVLASLAFIFICTDVIYFRVWEFLTPVASPQSTVRLSDSTVVKFAASWSTIYAILPDGRLRVETFEIRPGADRWTQYSGIIVPDKSITQWIAGSNWTTVAADGFQALGIQSDGSLWNLQWRWNPSEEGWRPTNSVSVTQLGSETNWRRVAGDSRGLLLLKKDGSLWVWGTNAYDWHDSVHSIPKTLALDLAMAPIRFGQQTDWTDLFASRGVYAKKRDSSIWRWGSWLGGTNHVSIMIQDTNLDGMWPNFVSTGDGSSVGVKMNGELWLLDEVESFSGITETRKFQLGQSAKWKVATFVGWSSIAAIRSDGTLWNWSDYWNLLNKKNQVRPVQLGNYSNWIACPLLQTRGVGAIVLAADGSLWVWNEPTRYIWLAPSRKPVYLGNIFTAQ